MAAQVVVKIRAPELEITVPAGKFRASSDDAYKAAFMAGKQGVSVARLMRKIEVRLNAGAKKGIISGRDGWMAEFETIDGEGGK